MLEMRRAHQEHNDPKGYDTILLPGMSRHRVFTKEEYRIGKDGAVLPPPPRRGRQKQRRSRVGSKTNHNNSQSTKNSKKRDQTRQTTLTFAFTRRTAATDENE